MVSNPYTAYRKPPRDYSGLSPAQLQAVNRYRRRVGQQPLELPRQDREAAWKARPPTRAESRRIHQRKTR